MEEIEREMCRERERERERVINFLGLEISMECIKYGIINEID